MVRYLNSALVAFAITASLFLGMRLLIQSGDTRLAEPTRGPMLDFVRLKKEETVEKKERKPKKPPKPETPPPKMQEPPMQASNMDNAANSMAFSADIEATSGLEGGLALQGGDGEYLPRVKVQPIYPRRAQARGIEGWVLVEFTVTPLGTVTNPVVVDAEPQGIFDKAALDAVVKWKYKPRVIDGKPTEVAGVQNKVTFKMN